MPHVETRLSISTSVFLSVHLSVFLSVCLPVCDYQQHNLSSDFDAVQYRSSLPNFSAPLQFGENQFSGSQTLRKGENEFVPVLYTFIDRFR
jgi:hypothetical protein